MQNSSRICDKCKTDLVNSSVMLKESMVFWDIKPPKIAYRTVELCLDCYNKSGLQKIEKEKKIWIVYNKNSLKEFHDKIF